MRAVLGVDIGTSSSKGVLVDFSGNIIASTTREHAVEHPHPGWAEMEMTQWWDEFCSISRELVGEHEIAAVATSGMGPCVGVADADGVPLRPAILYGIDGRAVEQIARMTTELGDAAIVERGGSSLSTQAVGPKLAWLAHHEPHVFGRARKLFMPASWLVYQLTGRYVLDHHSASQSSPMYDTIACEWFEDWALPLAGNIELPELVWSDEVVGTVGTGASLATGLPEGTPVVAGTIDAWAEAISVGAHTPGTLMIMYGTTMFFVNTTEDRLIVDSLWSTVGAFSGSRSIAAGMATSGAITSWLRHLLGDPSHEQLVDSAAASPAGSNGLLALPYFAGERTPIADPDARGMFAGLTVEHGVGDLYRSILEATAFGVRHNIAAMSAGGAAPHRVVSVGGGTQSTLWTQIVSDVTGVRQELPRVTIGASYGSAFLAASAVEPVDITTWNPVARVVKPNPDLSGVYGLLYGLYLELYEATSHISHQLAAIQRSSARF